MNTFMHDMEDDRFQFLATRRTDEELYERVNNRQNYLPETVEASLEELKSRGETFSDEELTVIAEDMQARRDLAQSAPVSPFSTDSRYNIIKDPDAPAFYSKRTIMAFSVIFSVLFGAILLAVNISKTKNANKTIWVVLFGLGFTVLSYYLVLAFGVSISLSVVSGLGGYYIMDAIFWKPYIGNTTLFRFRPVWVPLIIGVVLFVLVILSAWLQNQLPQK